MKKMYFTGGLYKFEELNIVSAAPLGKSSENFLLGNYADDLADALVLQVKAGMSDDDAEVVCRYFITEEDLGEMMPRYNDARIVDSSADGSAVLAADFNYVYIWNAATGELVHVLRSDEFSDSF